MMNPMNLYERVTAQTPEEIEMLARGEQASLASKEEVEAAGRLGLWFPVSKPHPVTSDEPENPAPST
jgi:hypothetical protein